MSVAEEKLVKSGAGSTAADGRHETIVIEPAKGWQAINWRELNEYRDLLMLMARRDVYVLYKQTVLGFAWAILRPLFSMIIFTFIFGNLAQVSSDGAPYALFNYVALVPWTYFAAAVTASTASLVTNAHMLSKVYFPRLIFPLTPVLAKMVDFGIAFLFIGVLAIYFRYPPNANIVFLPIVIVLMMLTALGVGLWLSALAVLYRDVNHAMQFMVQLLMYAAPVVWPLSSLTRRFGEKVTLIYGLYPMVGVIEGFRAAFLGTVPMPWALIGVGFLSALVLTITGAFYFRRMENIFADVA